jgi:DNA-directed RNA polymerase specialized sigma24 family protein
VRPSREQDRERLEQEINNIEHQRLLKDLHRGNPFLRQFRTWEEVVAFMRKGTSQDPRKDEILRPIIGAHAEDRDPKWRTVLLVIFWPGLESIHYQKRDWEPEPEDRWQDIVWTFFQVLCRIDVERRPSRLVQKVFNETVHRLHDEYRRTWDRVNREIAVEPEELEALSVPIEGIETSAIEFREAQAIEIRRLREYLDSGLITEPAYLLLVGTDVYGKTIVDCAREMGLSSAAARQRKSRAEAAIRRFLWKKDEP